MNDGSISTSVTISTADPSLGLLCACGGLRRASRAVTQLYDLVLMPTGLKTTQFIALRAIEEAGEIAQCDFAREYAVAVETLSRRFASLRRKGLVEVRIGANHCERIYRLTEKGRQCLNDALPYWIRAQERLRNTLGEEFWGLLFKLSDRIYDAAQEAAVLRTKNHHEANLDGHEANAAA